MGFANGSTKHHFGNNSMGCCSQKRQPGKGAVWHNVLMGCTQGYQPAAGAHHMKIMLAHQFWQQLKMLQYVSNQRNLISWVSVNNLCLGSMSKCILHIKTCKKQLQSYFLLAHYKTL